MAQKLLECERWQWRELVASEHGPPDPGTRLVLFVLALHMNDLGDKCFPSQELIATRTGLSVRSVGTHLKTAERLGWIRKYLKPRKGQSWYSHEYDAVIRAELAQFCTSKPWEIDPGWRRPENSAGRRGKSVDKSPENDQRPATAAQRPATIAERPANNDTTTGNLRHDDRQPLPTNSSSNPSSNTSLNTPHNVQPMTAARVGAIFSKAKSKPALSREQRIELAAKALDQGLDADFVKRQYCLTVEEVRQGAKQT